MIVFHSAAKPTLAPGCQSAAHAGVHIASLCRAAELGCATAALTVLVLVRRRLTRLLVFVQRDKEELKEATALLTAQQMSLEIIVNMCCSDGECCGHGQQR